MRAYLVGGAVRDRLLGIGNHDNDYVVVGETPEAMARRGFRPVGKDFPVFLHPETGEEYALARTERKSGKGHQGFVFHCSPDVTLEDDLRRRDLTVNAMAMDADGNVIDPHGGRRDLEDGVLRHVSGAFEEDPLRVLRVARLRARLGFGIAPETAGLMRRMAQRGDLDHLSAERVWAEIRKGIGEARPSLMLATLHDDLGALGHVVPELADLWAKPAAAAKPGGAGSRGARAARFADRCAEAGLPPESVFAGMLCRMGDDTEGSLRAIRATCERLRIPRRFRRHAEAAARARDAVFAPGFGEECGPVLDVLQALDWLRDPGLAKDTLRLLDEEAEHEGREGGGEAVRVVRRAQEALASERVAGGIRGLKEFTEGTVRAERLRGLREAGICR